MHKMTTASTKETRRWAWMAPNSGPEFGLPMVAVQRRSGWLRKSGRGFRGLYWSRMTILDPTSLPPEHVATLAAVGRVLDAGAAGLLGTTGERVELPPSVQTLLRSVVRLMEAGQQVTLFPALADQAAMARMQALDELTREAYALGLYDRNVPAEPSPR